MTTAKQEREQRRKEELQRRRDLKALLILKCGGACMTCGKKAWLLDLSHIKFLSAGGVTDEYNCIIECRKCHQIRHHQIKEE